ncbi:hypothetical protein [Gemmatimonas groenlandica]|uniref:Uncharacterized protein n=1 Tax=Gemmatimonas groenlandica TaxID=2732249 RepID=A0A6M4IVA0_9BACT|nr:hypothetical protein [Gemmatimonas groenlandica]QJR37527.1 hypothetical protein HKW67_19415 [Gemmatimonas groenlandica]
MGVVSFGLRFEMPRESTAVDRLVGQVPIHFFSLLTIGLLIVGLNPRVASVVPLGVISQGWGAVAGLTLTLCAGLLGYQLLFAGGQRAVGLGSMLQAGSVASTSDLARIPTLDPTRDFDELARLTGEFNRAGVRSAAMVRLRQAPDFIATLAAHLTNGTASSGAADHALAVVAMDAFTAEEQQRIAEPARSAMQRIAAYVESEYRYITKDRRKGMRKSWGAMFRTIAAKLASTGVDFPSTIAAFDRALDGPKD